MTRPTILLASGNPGKCREIRQVLGDLPVTIVSLADVAPVPEPVEDGATFAANARKKALYYARATGLWALADDSGLAVEAMDGAPGVYSARFAADRCAATDRETLDAANNALLLERLAEIPDAARTARFVCHLALADGESVLLEAQGAIGGRIGHVERGENGFGYDPLFVVDALGCTTAELPPEEKNAISHRGQAVRRFKALLAGYLGKSD
ncbi:MAG: RdgB/HAM1 family non-canonical purine NTP pyrophosphatase [Planctomycetota bacterium]|jgi:XTP/dITP diphosphohydrolase